MKNISVIIGIAIFLALLIIGYRELQPVIDAGFNTPNKYLENQAYYGCKVLPNVRTNLAAS